MPTLSPMMRRICAVLEETGSMRQGRLAVATARSQGYVCKCLKRLEEGGYVRRMPGSPGQTGRWPWLYARTGKVLPEEQTTMPSMDPGSAIDAMCRHA